MRDSLKKGAVKPAADGAATGDDGKAEKAARQRGSAAQGDSPFNDLSSSGSCDRRNFMSAVAGLVGLTMRPLPPLEREVLKRALNGEPFDQIAQHTGFSSGEDVKKLYDDTLRLLRGRAGGRSLIEN